MSVEENTEVDLQEVNTIMGLEEDQISQTDWPRCTKCKRYMFGHDGRRGQNCRLSVLSPDELKEDDDRIMEMRIKKKKELEQQRNTTTGSSTTTSDASSTPSSIQQPPPQVQAFQNQILNAFNNLGSQQIQDTPLNSSEISQTRNVPENASLSGGIPDSQRPPSQSSSINQMQSMITRVK